MSSLAVFAMVVVLVCGTQEQPPLIPRPFERAMTSRSVRSDTLSMAAAYHSSRIDWVYTTSSTFMQDAHAINNTVSAAMNANLPDTPGGSTYNVGRALNLTGSKIFLPWMTWKPTPYAGCVNNPAYTKGVAIPAAIAIMDAGADGIQHDDVRTNGEVYLHNGCYCSYCMAGFTPFLLNSTTTAQRQAVGVNVTPGWNYKEYLLGGGVPPAAAAALHTWFGEFQRNSTRGYICELRAAVDAHQVSKSRPPVTLSGNNGGTWDSPMDLLDYAIGELYPSTCGDNPTRNESQRVSVSCLAMIYEAAAAAGKVQELTMPKYRFPLVNSTFGTASIRESIAASYAMGSLMLAPWDVYITNTQPRFYGAPADFADLYGFAVTTRGLLKGFTNASSLAGGTPAVYPAADDASNIHVWLRRNGSTTVAHAVQWEAEVHAPTNATIVLDVGVFPVATAVDVYCPQLEGPVRVSTIPAPGNTRSFVMPAPLNPWCILVPMPQ